MRSEAIVPFFLLSVIPFAISSILTATSARVPSPNPKCSPCTKVGRTISECPFFGPSEALTTSEKFRLFNKRLSHHTIAPRYLSSLMVLPLSTKYFKLCMIRRVTILTEPQSNSFKGLSLSTMSDCISISSFAILETIRYIFLTVIIFRFGSMVLLKSASMASFRVIRLFSVLISCSIGELIFPSRLKLPPATLPKLFALSLLSTISVISLFISSDELPLTTGEDASFVEISCW